MLKRSSFVCVNFISLVLACSKEKLDEATLPPQVTTPLKVSPLATSARINKQFGDPARMVAIFLLQILSLNLMDVEKSNRFSSINPSAQ